MLYASLKWSILLLGLIVCEKGWRRFTLYKHLEGLKLSPMEGIHDLWNKARLDLVVGRYIEVTASNRDNACVTGVSSVENDGSTTCFEDTVLLWRHYYLLHEDVSIILTANSRITQSSELTLSENNEHHQLLRRYANLIQTAHHKKVWIVTDTTVDTSTTSLSVDNASQFYVKSLPLTLQQVVHNLYPIKALKTSNSDVYLNQDIIDSELHLHRIRSLLLFQWPESPEELLREVMKVLTFAYDAKTWLTMLTSFEEWTMWKHQILTKMNSTSQIPPASIEAQTREDLLSNLQRMLQEVTQEDVKELKDFYTFLQPQINKLLHEAEHKWYQNIVQGWQQYFVLYAPYCLPMLVPVSRALYKMYKYL